MPIYEYLCTKCHATSEHWVPSAVGFDVAPCTTKGCDGDAKRIISRFGVRRVVGAGESPPRFSS